MAAAAFESRPADTLRVGDVVHTRGGVRTVVGVTVAPRLVTVTVNDDALGEGPLMYVPSELVHTERVAR